MGKPDFVFPKWDMNPIGKYAQPEPNPTGPVEKYADSDVNKGVVHSDIQGYGAATKGRKFVSNRD
jgi:hypothetical protein